jgi:hypothetical protein
MRTAEWAMQTARQAVIFGNRLIDFFSPGSHAMRKSMIGMLAVVSLWASGCLIWSTAYVDAQGKKSGGGAATPTLESAANNAFQKLDKNGDGKLNMDEMPESLRKELARFDKNGDGLIDRAEFYEYFYKFAGGGQPGGAGGPAPGGGQPGGGKKGPMAPGGQPGGFGGGGFGGAIPGGGFGGGQPGGPGAFGPMMPGPVKLLTWEYRVLPRAALLELGKENFEAGLNLVGAEGWELCGIETSKSNQHTYLFRRSGMNKPRTDAKPAIPPASTEKADAKVDFRVYRLKHANAVEVARMLDELMRTGRSDSLRIVADPHTNSLLLRGPAQVHFDVEAILQHLDVPGAADAPRPGGGKKGGPVPFKRGGDNEPR